MKVFIGGIMQGSRHDLDIDDQDYRRVIAEAIVERHPGAEILDPNELHPNGVTYDDEMAKGTLLEMFKVASKADLLVAYAPTASMGTAIEMWHAYASGAPVITISPMAANWVVKYLSAAVLPDLAAFRLWVADGGLDNLNNLD